MAFDRDDTDSVYERLIRPVLKRNSITPVIINRHKSNEDLNNQIISQLNSCDLCIADLTYTRPSVYFEAGYAQRLVPVVYTVRKDHLGRNQPDDRRVHFDLQMKPLIKWKDDRDTNFKSMLERRLRSTFLRDWKRKAAVNQEREQQRSAFANLTLTARLRSLKRLALLELRRFGFRSFTVSILGDEPSSKVSELATRSGLLVSRVYRGQTFDVVTVYVVPAVSKRDLEQLQPLTSFWPFLRDIREHAGLRKVTIHNLVVTLQPTPSSRIEAVLTNLGRGEWPGHYRRVEIGNSEARATIGSMSFVATMSFMADPKSESEFRTAIRNLLTKMLRNGEV